MAGNVKFWDKIADKYSRDPIKDMASYEHKLALTRALMKPDMKVLEFGCGTGSTALLHAPHVGEYRATDISSKMIEIARAKEGAESVRFEVAEFDTLPLDEASLDMILGLSVLHLVDDTQVTIAKAYASLKPGGYFVTSTPCVGSMWYLKLIAPIGQALGKFPHLCWFTEDGLRDMLRGVGFEIVEDWRPKGKIQALFIVARKAG